VILALAILVSTIAGDSTNVYHGMRGELRVPALRESDVTIRIDARFDEEIWQRAPVLTGFTIYEPNEGRPALDETEVRVFYTEEAIYFGIRAFDSQPNRIRANRVERDRSAFEDDWIRIMLDTYGDQRQAYIFYVNALGIQTDGVWQEGQSTMPGRPPIDFNQDYIWSSEGRVDAEGWIAEIRIPYVSLRFREMNVQDWGINFARETKKNGFKMSWAPITANRSSTLAQSGLLTGLEGLRPRRLVELNPVATGRRVGERDDADIFRSQSFSAEFGFNARLGITQNLVADATWNPDFSQVESDADQVTVNERFAIFFPEKRPFFLEGTEIFRTPQPLVYTRAIADPIGGIKLTGKLGPFQAGYLGAIDESPLDDPDASTRAAFNIVRLRRDIGSGSTLGLLFTDRSLLEGGAFNRVVGADTRLLFLERYALTAQFGHSWSRDARGLDVSAAPIFAATLDRTGRSFNWRLAFDDIDPAFQARSGFLRRIGDARALAQTGVNLFSEPGSLIERVGLSIKYEGFFRHDGLWDGEPPIESEIELQPSLNLRGSSSVSAILRSGMQRFEPDAFEGFTVQNDGPAAPFVPTPRLRNMLGFALLPNIRLTDRIQLNGRMYAREIPIFAEGTLGFELQLSPELQLRPTSGLALNVSITRSRIERSRDDSFYSRQSITRINTQYQFSKALFARVIAQYNLIARDTLRDPVSGQPLLFDGLLIEPVDRGEFGFNALLAYEPSPGTLMYIGWSRQMAGAETYAVRDMERMAEGLFLKVSWLWRR
jgi:hypothetical protein